MALDRESYEKKEPRAEGPGEQRKALDALSRYLALRDHSRKELEEKLKRRFSEDVIQKTLAAADAYGWLRPEEEIAVQVAESLARRGKSRRYIQAQLAKKGLPRPEFLDEDEVDKVRRLVEKKFGLVTELSYEDKVKAQRYLLYRGFENRFIRQVLNERN